MVAFHAFQWLDDRFWVGAAGVDVFFVISGFIIWTVAARGESQPGPFLWRRFTRVAPAYWLVTFLVAGVALVIAVHFLDAGDTPRLAFCGLIALFVIYTHRANIARMAAGTESRARRLWLFRSRAA